MTKKIEDLEKQIAELQFENEQLKTKLSKKEQGLTKRHYQVLLEF
ncbi:MAG: uncharacterized small protein (DUF1192 family), partial [bacterium]